MPGTIVSTKDFTVTNEGNSDISEYQVYLENVYNDFSVEGQGDVKLTIICTLELEDGYMAKGMVLCLVHIKLS